jgi:hypothetical protein
MLFPPLPLAITALHTIRRIILDPLTVIISPTLTLARTTATHCLLGMVAGRREEFPTVRTMGKCHVNLWHCLTAVCACLQSRWICSRRSSDSNLSPGLPKSLKPFDFATRSWSTPWHGCNTMHVGEPTLQLIIVGVATRSFGKCQIHVLLRAVRPNRSARHSQDCRARWKQKSMIIVEGHVS